MPTPENKVKGFIDNYMKRHFPEAFRYAPPGVGYFGRNGMPDRLWFIRANETTSVIAAIEAKADNGTPTELQIKTLTALAKQGAVSAIVVGKDLDHLGRIRDEILRRVRLANEKPGTSSVPAPDSDHRVSPQE